MATKRRTTAKKAVRRRIIANGVVSGQSANAIAQSAGTSKRTVQRIAAEPETQFLITEAFRPYQARLLELAGVVIDAVDEALGAMKTDKQDHLTRLKAVERYGDVLELAQGKVQEKPAEADRTWTWEEITAIYKARKLSAETDAARTEAVG